MAATRPNRGVPVCDLGVPDARLDLIDDGPEGEFMNWPTGDRDARAGELAEAMIARAGRPLRSLAAEPIHLLRWP